MLQVMDDLRAADVDFLTIGQYLQPTRKHHPVVRFVHAGGVQGLRDHRLRQGLPDGLGEPADALVASCRRGFRPAARGARGRAGAPDGVDAAIRDRRAGSRHSADEMFDLVADVERYPEFVPLCESLTVQSRAARTARRSSDRRHDRRLQGRSARPSPRGSSLDRAGARHRRRISQRPVPASRRAAGASSRRARRDAASISRSTTSSARACSALLMGAVFDRAFRKFAEAFEERADAVYGVVTADRRPGERQHRRRSASHRCRQPDRRRGRCRRRRCAIVAGLAASAARGEMDQPDRLLRVPPPGRRCR